MYLSFLHVFFKKLFLLNLLWLYWIIKLLYRFQLYISIAHDMYIALCAQKPKSNHLMLSYIWPLLPSSTPQLLPSGNHHIMSCVYEFDFYIHI